MPPLSRLVLVLSLLLPCAAAHGQSSTWDGEWIGEWNASDPTSFKIEDGRVVAFFYKGTERKVDHASIEDRHLHIRDKDMRIDLTLEDSSHATGQNISPSGIAFGLFSKVADGDGRYGTDPNTIAPDRPSVRDD